jgi:hypothetical protein
MKKRVRDLIVLTRKKLLVNLERLSEAAKLCISSVPKVSLERSRAAADCASFVRLVISAQ